MLTHSSEGKLAGNIGRVGHSPQSSLSFAEGGPYPFARPGSRTPQPAESLLPLRIEETWRPSTRSPEQRIATQGSSTEILPPPKPTLLPVWVSHHQPRPAAEGRQVFPGGWIRQGGGPKGRGGSPTGEVPQPPSPRRPRGRGRRPNCHDPTPVRFAGDEFQLSRQAKPKSKTRERSEVGVRCIIR